MLLRKEGIGFYLFIFVFVLGSLISVSSSDWIGVWFGLEMNLFSVVPFFSGVGLSKELESVAKYFIVQAVGSIILLMGSLFGFMYYGSIFVGYVSFSGICSVLVVLGLMIKMGLVPFHFWVPSVMSGISWVSCLVLSVWQKVVPLLILVSFVEGAMLSVLVVVGCLGSIVGGLGGFLQTQLRVLLGYSSIGHSGWLVVGGMYSVVSSVCYFVIYSAISVILFYMLSVVEVSNYSSLSKGYSVVDIKILGLLVLLLVSLAGLPPTLGFAMKWSVFLGVLPNCPFALAVLVLGSLLSLYYYLCLSFSWYVFSFSSVWSFFSLSYGKLIFFVFLFVSVVLGYVSFLGVSVLCV